MLNVEPEGKKLWTTFTPLPNPPFGKSDHDSILLIPVQNKKLKLEAPMTRSIKKWSDEADAKLQDCFASTDEYVQGFPRWH